MAIDLNNWVPKYVKQVLGYSSGQSIKAARWNELWNLSIEQGDYNSETLDLLIDLVNTKSNDEEIKEILDTKADQAWVVSQLALKTDVSVFDAFRNQQNSTNQTVQTALNNRYTKAETDERLNLKFDKTDAQPLLKEVTFDAQTGVFTITRQNGTTFQINTLLEKVPVQFLLEDNKLILIAEDGTRQEADLSAFIDVYTFQDSATVQFVQTMSTNRTVTASVKDKSIGFEQLKDNVYQSISDDRVAAEAAAESALASKTAAENAAAQATTKASEASQSAATALESKNTAVSSAEAAVVSEQSAERDALMAQSYAVGGTGLRPGEDTDNAKYYSQQAGEIVGGDFATKTELQQHEEYAEETYAKKDDVPQGVIKADGTTVTSAMIPFAQGAKNTSGALGEAQFRNVYFGDTELVEGESELPEGTLYITPEVEIIETNSGGKRTCRFVVGTTTAGWTAADCDYLCDGVADDVEINAAIQALPSTGGEIVILDGTYNIEKWIFMSKQGIIRGNGSLTILKRKYSAIEGTPQNPVVLLAAMYSKIQNLTIDGNPEEYPDAVYDFSGVKPQALGTCIEDCVFINNYIGVYNAGREVTVKGCYFETKFDFVNLPANVSAAIVAEDSIVSQNQIRGYQIGVRGNGSIISNNIFVNCHNAIFLSEGVAASNSFEACSTGVYCVDYCTVVNNYCHNCDIGIVTTGKASVISANVVYRGTGTASDYNDSQNTIYGSASATDFLIIGNIMKGKGDENNGKNYVNNII